MRFPAFLSDDKYSTFDDFSAGRQLFFHKRDLKEGLEHGASSSFVVNAPAIFLRAVQSPPARQAEIPAPPEALQEIPEIAGFTDGRRPHSSRSKSSSSSSSSSATSGATGASVSAALLKLSRISFSISSKVSGFSIR